MTYIARRGVGVGPGVEVGVAVGDDVGVAVVVGVAVAVGVLVAVAEAVGVLVAVAVAVGVHVAVGVGVEVGVAVAVGVGVTVGVQVGVGVVVAVGVGVANGKVLSAMISGSQTGPACNKTTKIMRRETIAFTYPLMRTDDRDHSQKVIFCQIDNDVLSGGSVEDQCLRDMVVEAKAGGIDAEIALREVCEQLAAAVEKS